MVYYAYDLPSAQALLAELGFEDTDGNGIVNWTSGPLEGEDLTIAITATEDQAEAATTGEALVTMLGQAGIKVNYRPVTSTARREIETSGEWEMHVSRMGQNFALPFTSCNDLGPTNPQSPVWHREGEEPRELLDFEHELIEVINAYCATTDPVERKTLINQYNNIFTENLYALGVFSGRYGLGIAKRYRNVPAGTPVTLYQWVEDADAAAGVDAGRGATRSVAPWDRSGLQRIGVAWAIAFQEAGVTVELSEGDCGEAKSSRRLASSNLMTRTLMKQADRRIRDRARSVARGFVALVNGRSSLRFRGVAAEAVRSAQTRSWTRSP